MNPDTSIMIIAGEVSGDMHAAKLVSSIRQRMPDISFFGIGGENMRAEGVDTLYDVKDMAVMGFSEVIRRFSFFKRVFNEMVTLAEHRRPDMVLLVDYPGFNLRFARRVHNAGIKTVYYICPQVWAWNRARIPKMAECVDELITIFPFEKEHFEGTGLNVSFAGHPLVDEVEAVMQEPVEDLPWNGDPHVALLPGSRSHEIRRILPVMLSAARLVEEKCSDVGFIIPTPSPREAGIVENILAGTSDKPCKYSVVTANTRQVLRSATAAMVASGTATVETAMMLCPMVIAYKVGTLTYLMGKMLVRVDHIGMVNIIAGDRICPEFIQEAATPEALSKAVLPLLENTPARDKMIKDLEAVKKSMGKGGAADEAADIIIESLHSA